MTKMVKKMRFIRNCMVACLFAWAGAEAAAQDMPVSDAGQRLELSLQQAVDIALDGNPTIKIADMEVERFEYVRKEAVGNLLPTITATGQYSRMLKNQKMIGMELPMKNDIQSAASLTLPLFAPGVWSNLKLTDDQMYAAVEAARGSRIDMVAEVKKAYYNILLGERSLEVLLASEATISETVEDTRNKFENGLASEYDLITAQVQLSNLQPTILQTRNSIEIAQRMLRMYMGLPGEVSFTLTDSFDRFVANAPSDVQLYSKDISGNSSLRTLDLQGNILERQLKLQRTQRMPTLVAIGSYSLSGNDLDKNKLGFGAATGATQIHRFDWQNPITIGAQLSIPIFSGLRNVNKEKQIRNQIEQLSRQRDYYAESLNVQISSSLSNVHSALARMQANLSTVDQAQKGYDISRTRYDAGMGTMLEVNNAELQLTQARLNYTQAIYDYLSAAADYEQITGKDY